MAESGGFDPQYGTEKRTIFQSRKKNRRPEIGGSQYARSKLGHGPAVRGARCRGRCRRQRKSPSTNVVANRCAFLTAADRWGLCLDRRRNDDAACRSRPLPPLVGMRLERQELRAQPMLRPAPRQSMNGRATNPVTLTQKTSLRRWRLCPPDIRGHARSCRLSERRAGIIEKSTARRMPGFSIGRDLPAPERSKLGCPK